MAVNSPQRDSNGNLIVNDIKVWNVGNCQAVYGEIMKEDPSKNKMNTQIISKLGMYAFS